ncbi:MAG: hypothetical protein ISS92_03625 [Candidatus Omnitrophica bacterium]|nr:hypothetical protein [Candidatus Omnitrophota bacterium]
MERKAVKKACIFLFAFLVFCSAFLPDVAAETAAETITETAVAPAPEAIPEILYATSYECRDLNGDLRWRASYELKHKEGNIYSVTENGKGVYSGFRGKVSWIAEMEFNDSGVIMRPIWTKRRVFNEAGKEIAVQTQDFDFNKRIVTCRKEDLIGNKSVEKKFAFTKNVITRLLQGVYTRRFIESGEPSRDIQLVSPEPALYNLKLKRLGTEEIEINGRKRKAYKVCLDPQLGALSFIKIFLPKAYTWHFAKPRFEWLKYEGVENSIKSPIVEITILD